MPGPAGLDEVYAAVEETARLLDVPCSPRQVQPLLSAFGGGLPEAHIVFSMAAGEHHRGELDVDFTAPAGGLDPYATALEHGLIAPTGHAVGSLLESVRARCTVTVYGVEYGLAGGFKKAYAFFPLDAFPPLAEFAALEHMPPALGAVAATLTGHGLGDKVSSIGINYPRRTLNVYLAAQTVPAERKLALLEALGFPVPDERVAAFVRRSFSVYPTVNWDTAQVERICFSVKTKNPQALPAPFDPQLEAFARRGPQVYEGQREFVSAVALAPTGQAYYKLAAYYQKAAESWNAAFAATGATGSTH